MHQSIQAFYDRKYTQGSEIPRTSKIYTIDCVPDDTPLDILDVGCGSGSNSLALAAKGHKVRGVDISEEGIARYRTHGFDGHVVDLESGILTPPKNSASLAGALEHCLTRKWDEDRIAARFKRSWEDAAKETYEVCLQVLHDTRQFSVDRLSGGTSTPFV